jgi:hypothetical protein
MIGLTPDIVDVEVPQHGTLRITFADGLEGEVEVLSRMRGPVFERARTPAGFLRFVSMTSSGQSAGPGVLI